MSKVIEKIGANVKFTKDFANGRLGVGNTSAPEATLHVCTLAVASTAEPLQKWNVTDDSTSYILVKNGTATGARFMPLIESKSANASDNALSVNGVITTDTGTVPVFNFKTNLNTGVVGTRPLFALYNHTTSVFGIGADGLATFDGFTKLGTSAPSVKMVKLTGTTGAAEGDSTSIAHGVTYSKIISFTCIVDNTTNVVIPNTITTGLEYTVLLDATNFVVTTHATNSENILSASIKIVFWYES